MPKATETKGNLGRRRSRVAQSSISSNRNRTNNGVRVWFLMAIVLLVATLYVTDTIAFAPPLPLQQNQRQEQHPLQLSLYSKNDPTHGPYEPSSCYHSRRRTRQASSTFTKSFTSTCGNSLGSALQASCLVPPPPPSHLQFLEQGSVWEDVPSVQASQHHRSTRKYRRRTVHGSTRKHGSPSLHDPAIVTLAKKAPHDSITAPTNSNNAWEDLVQTVLPSSSSSSSRTESAVTSIDSDPAYQRRKADWASKYASVEALRATFGVNRNGFWGDLDADRTRRLYKTLLPKALLELHAMGVQAQDLAPLAYRARVAAKLYARERSYVTLRIGSHMLDGIRTWQRYGQFDVTGMSYTQVWEKYAKAILEDADEDNESHAALREEDVTAQICLKILESSCRSNTMIDRLCLASGSHNSHHEDHDTTCLVPPHHCDDLNILTQDLERDVWSILDEAQTRAHDPRPHSPTEHPPSYNVQRWRTLRTLARVKRRLERLQHHPHPDSQ
jgi:hypothetical protein